MKIYITIVIAYILSLLMTPLIVRELAMTGEEITTGISGLIGIGLALVCIAVDSKRELL